MEQQNNNFKNQKTPLALLAEDLVHGATINDVASIPPEKDYYTEDDCANLKALLKKQIINPLNRKLLMENYPGYMNTQTGEKILNDYMQKKYNEPYSLSPSKKKITPLIYVKISLIVASQ